MHVCELNSIRETKCALVLLIKLFFKSCVVFGMQSAYKRNKKEDFVCLFLFPNA